MSDKNTVVRGYTTTEFGQVHYRRVNAKSGEKVALVALHLVPNSSQVFQVFLQHMDSQREVVAFDLPGFGMSDPAPEETIHSYAAVIKAAIQALGYKQVDLLGYHTGAAVAAEICQRDPVMVRRMILAAIPVLTTLERQQFAALPPIAFDDEGKYLMGEWQRSMNWRGPKQSIDSVKRTFAEKMRPGARERGPKAIINYNLSEVLGTLNVPTMALRPKDDLWEATLRAKELLPEAQWVELPNYGHGLFEVAGATMAKLVHEFLS